MALEYSTPTKIGSKAPAFSLPGVDGKTYTLESFANAKGLLVVFMCNHCPYVIAIHERLNQIAKDYAAQGIAVIGINSHTFLMSPNKSHEIMMRFARLILICTAM